MMFILEQKEQQQPDITKLTENIRSTEEYIHTKPVPTGPYFILACINSFY